MIFVSNETLSHESATDGMSKRSTNVFGVLVHSRVFRAHHNAEQTWTLLHSTSVVDQEQGLSMVEY